MVTTQKITLDLHTKSYYSTLVYAKQGDADSRKILVTLTANSQPYTIPDGVTASFRCLKRDGTCCESPAEIGSDGRIGVTLTDQMLAVPGEVIADISMADKAGRVLSTFSFVINVEAAPYGEQIPSESEFLELRAIITESRKLIGEYETALEQLNAIQNSAEAAAGAASAAAQRAANSETNAKNAEEGASLAAQNAENAAQSAVNSEQRAGDSERNALNYEASAKASAELAQGVAKEMTDAGYMTRLTNLESVVADILYEPIDITSCSVSPSVAELGATVQTVTVSWGINKTPVSQSLGGEAVDVSLRSKQLTGLSAISDRSFTVKAVDERNAADTVNVWLRFYNGVYHGVLTEGTVINSAAILSLAKALQAGKAKTFTVTAGAAQRIAYALPSRYGTPAFNVGGFDGGFHLAATFDFTNASGYTEEYQVWLSDNLGLGQTTVKVT